MSSGDIVTLKDGTVVQEITAQVVYESLHTLLGEDIRAFYDLVMIARGGNYWMSQRTRERLQGDGLLETDGKPHTDVAAIIRNAVEGKGWKMRIVSPVKKEA